MVCNASLYTNLRTFNLCMDGIIDITQFLFNSSYMYMYFALSQRLEIQHKTNSSVFILFLERHTFYQSSLAIAY